MLVNTIIMNLSGYVVIEVEGFFIQRFVNLCISKGIYLDEIKHLNQSKIITSVNKNDFRDICKIAKHTKCKVKITRKGGLPFCAFKYRKRKIFAGLLVILVILSFAITRFVWNIEIKGNEKIADDEIIELLNNNGIHIGMKISKIETESLINKIRLNRDEVAWAGIEIKGTNLIVNIVEADEKPEIIDESQKNNIIANKAGIISRINVQSGTARVNVGDSVEKNQLLVEGVMEGKYTGTREVNSQADIFAKVVYSKSETKKLVEEVKNMTGNEKKSYIIKFNNFKINLNKGVSNFENYDTIVANKKIRLFSNYYLPIELEKTVYKEFQSELKTYTIEELTNELKTKLEKELLDDLKDKYEEFIESNSNVEVSNNKITVNVNCVVEEKIGVNQI